MDLAPGEYGSTVDYDALKKGLIVILEKDWGPRCGSLDTEDFPELEGETDIMKGRCPVCLVYERFDAFWEAFVVS